MTQIDWMPDRRRDLRIDLLADLQGHLITLDEQVGVRQLSLGGMTIETTAPLSPRVVHDFRLGLGELAVIVKGRVMHSRISVREDQVTYLSGVQFIETTPESYEAMRLLLERAAPRRPGDPDRG
jgi:hypothetical protein